MRDPDTKAFLMFYEAVAEDGSRSIGLATSADGKGGWQRQPQPLLAAAGGAAAWDAGGIGAPCAVPMAAGRWRLYYAGRKGAQGPWEGIGVALGVRPDSSGSEPGAIAFKRRSGQQQQPAAGAA